MPVEHAERERREGLDVRAVVRFGLEQRGDVPAGTGEVTGAGAHHRQPGRGVRRVVRRPQLLHQPARLAELGDRELAVAVHAVHVREGADRRAEAPAVADGAEALDRRRDLAPHEVQVAVVLREHADHAGAASPAPTGPRGRGCARSAAIPRRHVVGEDRHPRLDEGEDRVPGARVEAAHPRRELADGRRVRHPVAGRRRADRAQRGRDRPRLVRHLARHPQGLVEPADRLQVQALQGPVPGERGAHPDGARRRHRSRRRTAAPRGGCPSPR